MKVHKAAKHIHFYWENIISLCGFSFNTQNDWKGVTCKKCLASARPLARVQPEFRAEKRSRIVGRLRVRS